MAEKKSDTKLDIFSGTGIKHYDNSVKGFGDRQKVETPVLALDSFLGGGLPFGSIVEVAGQSKGGKTTFCYQTIGKFQKQYPDGIVIILESEVSHDRTRMEHTFGIDVSRIYIYPGVTLNGGFEALINVSAKMGETKKEKGKKKSDDTVNPPILVLWDSISNSPTELQTAKQDVNGGGLAEGARLIKNYFKILMSNMSNVDMIVLLISQVSQKIGGYVGGFTTSGGEGLKHDVHLKLWIDGGKDELVDNYYVSKEAKMKIEKSKISPPLKDISLTLDIANGGSISETYSFIDFVLKRGILDMVVSGWYNLSAEMYKKYPQYVGYFESQGIVPGTNKRIGDLSDMLANDKVLIDMLLLMWVDDIGEHYSLQRKVCENHRQDLIARLIPYENITVLQQ